MHHVRRLVFASLSLVLFPFIAVAQNSGSESPEEIWIVQDGRITFQINRDLLDRYGIGLADIEEMPNDPTHPVPRSTDPEWCAGGFRAGKVGQLDLTLLDVSEVGGALSFDITESSDLTFRVRNGLFVPYGLVGGSIRATGGVSFVAEETGAKWEMRNFALEYLNNPNDGPGGDPDPDFFRIYSDRGAQPLVIDVHNTMTAFMAMNSLLVLAHNDVVISQEWATAMGRSELAGRLIGGMQIYAIARPTGPTYDITNPVAPHFWEDDRDVLDVALGFLDSILEAGREGVYPDGISGLAMATTSCNKGTVDIPWEAPMDVDHPGIPMELYRETDTGDYTKFEMIGRSDVKHGFFALSNSQCDPCVHFSDGTFLGVGCSDTYGTYNNSDRNWLAPRDEWDPYLGTWDCVGSHFADYQPDCIRRHGSGGHTPTEHLLVVRDEDLGDVNATYYYEAMYVLANDAFKMNNGGSRKCTMTWNGSGWNFATPSSNNALVEGPAVLRWNADLHSWAQVGTDDGYVILSSKATDLGGGMYHYEYALYNFDSDRRIRSITMPVDLASQVTNVEFNDGDLDPTNDWAATVLSDQVTFETSVYEEGVPSNALMFELLFNFRFDADAPPQSLDLALGVYKPGNPTEITAEGVAPGTNTSSISDSPLASRLVYLHPSQPNPLGPSTTIRFDLARSMSVRLDVYDSGGRRVRSLLNGLMDSGSHDFVWDGTDGEGQKLGSGVYYYRMTAGGETATQSVVVVQ